MATATTATMPPSRAGPSASTVRTLTEAPSRTTGDFQQRLGAEHDAVVPARPRLPGCADGDAEQDREHQRFEIGLAGEAHFDQLQDGGQGGDEAAEEKAGQETEGEHGWRLGCFSGS